MVVNDEERATGRDLHELLREVFHLHGILAGIQDRVHEQAGMSTPQRRVLAVLERMGAATAPHIAMETGVSRQFALKTCDDMAVAGLVEYVDNPHHKRSRLVRATDVGREARRAAQHEEERLISRMLPELASDDVGRVREVLAAIRSRLQKS